MNEKKKNPLVSCSSKVQKVLSRNKGGRPSTRNAITFTQEPKSFVSQMLSKIKNDDKVYGTSIGGIFSSKEDINIQSDHTDKSQEHLNFISLCDVHLDEAKITTVPQQDVNSIEDNDCTIPQDLSLLEDNCSSNSYLLVHGVELENDIQDAPCSKPVSRETLCKICNHKSNSTKEHRMHLLVHKDTKLFKCNFPDCAYACKLSSNLIKHKRTHTNEKAYLCDQCTFRSNFINSLKVHKRLHTAEKPYFCDHCPYRCNSSSNLKKHCLHRHNDLQKNYV